jgi:peptidoglycan/LPS O-acetylase OafA/YrhL
MKPFYGQNNAYDSLRGISNIVVVLVHVEYIRSFFGYVNHYANPAVYHVGRICVSGFFVLSGFLITRNLLKIKNEPDSLGKKFGIYYLKRILRIFPMYYTIIFLSMYVLPHIHALRYNIPAGIIDARTVLPEVSHYYYFLFPQVPLSHRIVLPFAEPTWSIGIEELFYVVVPLLLFLLPVKKNWLLVAAAISVIIKVWYRSTLGESHFTDPTFALMIYCRFECILMGCYAAFLYHEKAPLYQKLTRSHALLATALVPVFLAFMKLESYLYIHTSICLAILILYVSKGQFRFLENKFLIFMGKLSFSIYLTHELAIVFFLNLKGMATANKHSSIFLYACVLVTAIGLAYLFYKTIEEPFVKLKDKVDVFFKPRRQEKLETKTG